MKAEVEHVYKNMRYKILRFNEDFYIIDMDRSFWFFLIPFIFWVIPHKAYKIDNKKFKQIQMPKSEQMSTGSIALLGGGISILFVNLLKPLLSQLNLHITLGIKILILIIIFSLCVYMRIYIQKRLFLKLNKKADIESLNAIKLRITPEKPQHYLIFVIFFLFFWGAVFMASILILTEGNVIILMFTPLFLMIALLWNTQVIRVGGAKIEIIDR